MKTFVPPVLALAVFVSSAAAAPVFKVETVVTDSSGNREKPTVVARLSLRTESGKRAVTRVDSQKLGVFEYAITPVLQENGSIETTQVVTRQLESGRVLRSGPFEQKTAFGQNKQFSLGPISFSTQVSEEK